MWESESLAIFKQRLQKSDNDLMILYFYGERWPSVNHARMRIGCSKLNNNVHVIDDPICTCGTAEETAEHFFLECINYDDRCRTILTECNNLTSVCANSILFGNNNWHWH